MRMSELWLFCALDCMAEWWSTCWDHSSQSHCVVSWWDYSPGPTRRPRVRVRHLPSPLAHWIPTDFPRSTIWAICGCTCKFVNIMKTYLISLSVLLLCVCKPATKPHHQYHYSNLLLHIFLLYSTFLPLCDIFPDLSLPSILVVLFCVLFLLLYLTHLHGYLCSLLKPACTIACCSLLPEFLLFVFAIWYSVFLFRSIQLHLSKCKTILI